jgi:hypothetical protein
MGGMGGGIYIYDSSPKLLKLRIIGNSALNNQGMAGSGGGIWMGLHSPSGTSLENLTISNNSAGSGGGIYFDMGAGHEEIINLVNVVISDNAATNYGGGGIGGLIKGDGSSLNLVNSTIVGNSAHGNGGGAIHSNGGGINMFYTTLKITNSIIYGNTPKEINLIGSDYYGSSTITSTYSDIQGGKAEIVTEGDVTVNWLDGNIDTDPLFGNGYHLSDYSPAIGTGTSTNAPETDLEGTPRPNPTGSNPDMGAYENPLGTPQQQLACSAEPTIKSVKSGYWDSPNTWSENRVPGINDVVAIQKDHFIRIKTSYNTTMVDGLCNHGMLANWYKY